METTFTAIVFRRISCLHGVYGRERRLDVGWGARFGSLGDVYGCVLRRASRLAPAFFNWARRAAYELNEAWIVDGKSRE